MPSTSRIAGHAFEPVSACGKSFGCRYRAVIMDALAAANVTPSEVDLLIYAGVYRREYIVEPSMACLIAKAAGFGQPPTPRDGFLAFDVLAGPSGVLHSMSLASEMIAAHRKRCVVVVTGDLEPNPASASAPPLGIASSAAAVVLLADPAEDCHFGNLHVAADYDLEEGLVRFTKRLDGGTCIVSRGHAKDPCEAEEIVARAVKSALDGEGITPEDVDLVLVCGPREPFECVLGRVFGIKPERIVAPAPSSAHPFSAGLVAAFAEAHAGGRLKPGTRCLLLGYSDIAEATCLLYRF